MGFISAQLRIRGILIFTKLCRPREFYFRETSQAAKVLFLRNFVPANMKLAQNGELNVTLTDVGKSCSSRLFLTSQL